MGNMALYFDVSDWTLFIRVSLILVAWVIGKFSIALYRVRRKFQLMQKAGLVSVSFHVFYSCVLSSLRRNSHV